MTAVQAWSCWVFFGAAIVVVIAALFVNDLEPSTARAVTYTALLVTVLAFLVLLFSLVLGY